MRLECAVRWGLASAICACAGAALSVFALRWTGHQTLPAPLFAALPAAAGVLGALVAFTFTRFSPAAAATALDRRAGTQEHLVTWLYLRGQKDSDMEPLRGAFKQAQRGA